MDNRHVNFLGYFSLYKQTGADCERLKVQGSSSFFNPFSDCMRRIHGIEGDGSPSSLDKGMRICNGFLVSSGIFLLKQLEYYNNQT